MGKKKKRTPEPISGKKAEELAFERLKNLLSEEEQQLLKAELEKPLRQAFRYNPLKTTQEVLLNRLKQDFNLEVEPVPFCDSGWWVENSDRSISASPDHHFGKFYIQDAASMLPVSLFDFDMENPLVLDMAASPGGKTTHLISRIMDHGLVIANDASRERITALKLVLQTWGGANCAITNFPGERFGSWYPETFDAVLLDAPCSMQNLRSTENKPMRSISDREKNQLSKRQSKLLFSGLQALKVGGQMVYATCTLNPEEDECVLQEMLDTFGESVEIVNVEAKLPAPLPALPSFACQGEERKFNHDVRNAVRLFPHQLHTSGFFCALIRKVKSISSRTKQPPIGGISTSRIREFGNNETGELLEQLKKTYGFDLEKILLDQKLRLYRFDDVVYAIPEMWLEQFFELPFVSVGMRIGEYQPDGFMPSFSWAARFGDMIKKSIVVFNKEQCEDWLNGEDIPMTHTLELPSKYIIIKDEPGRYLGRGKYLGDRVRNLLPKRVVL